MQEKDSDLKMAAELTKKTLIFLADFCDNSFYSCMPNAKGEVSELDEEPVFTNTYSLRPREKKRLFSYERKDDPIQDSKERY